MQSTKFVLKLPKILQNWNFLPLPLRSLKPYDELITKFCCACLIKKSKVTPVENYDLEEFVNRETIAKF